jgi:hypothetical protein
MNGLVRVVQLYLIAECWRYSWIGLASYGLLTENEAIT